MDDRGWDDRYATNEFIWNAGPNQFVEEHLEDLTPGTAIDLAAGEGRNAVWLAEQGWNATAVDFSAVGLEKASRLAADRGVSITTVTADATTWAPEAPVDLVLLAYFQLPSAQQVAVLERAKSWVRPGGTVFVVAHDRDNLEHGYGGPPVEDVLYEVDRTVAALDGLDIQVAEVVERHVEKDSERHVALDTLVIARAG